MSKQDDSSGFFVQILRDATPFEMGLIAFIVFPAISSGWRSILEELLPNQESLRIAILLVGYVALIALMIYGKMIANQSQIEERDKDRKIESAKEIIRQRLSRKEPNKQFASYDWLRRNCGPDESEWSNELLDELFKRYPLLFCYQPIAPDSRPGLGLLLEPERVEEDS